jgi:hypothetical protein
MIPSRVALLPDRPSSFITKISPEPSPAPPSSPAEPTAKPSSSWQDHVKSTYASLKESDPGTTFKQAMVRAKATYKK